MGRGIAVNPASRFFLSGRDINSSATNRAQPEDVLVAFRSGYVSV